MAHLAVPAYAWAILAIVVLTLVSIDLFAHRGDHVDARRRAVAWTLV